MSMKEEIRNVYTKVMEFYKENFPLIYQELRVDRIEIKHYSVRSNARIVGYKDNPFHIHVIRLYVNGRSKEEVIESLVHELAHIVYWQHDRRFEWLKNKLLELVKDV